MKMKMLRTTPLEERRRGRTDTGGGQRAKFQAGRKALAISPTFSAASSHVAADSLGSPPSTACSNRRASALGDRIVRRRAGSSLSAQPKDWDRLLGPEGLVPEEVPVESVGTVAPPRGHEQLWRGEPPAEVRQLEIVWAELNWPAPARDAVRVLLLPPHGRRVKRHEEWEEAVEAATSLATREIDRLLDLRDGVKRVLEEGAAREKFFSAVLTALDRARGAPREVDSFIRQLRKATLGCCEALRLWRQRQKTPRPFRWRGVAFAQRIYEDSRRLRAHPRAASFLKADVLSSPVFFPVSKHVSGGGGSAPRVARYIAAQRVLELEAGSHGKSMVESRDSETVEHPPPRGLEGEQCEAAKVVELRAGGSESPLLVLSPADDALSQERPPVLQADVSLEAEPEPEQAAASALHPVSIAPEADPRDPSTGSRTPSDKRQATPGSRALVDQIISDSGGRPPLSPPTHSHVPGDLEKQIAAALRIQAFVRKYAPTRVRASQRTSSGPPCRVGEDEEEAEQEREHCGGCERAHAHEDSLFCADLTLLPEPEPCSPPLTPTFEKVFRSRPGWLRHSRFSGPLHSPAQQRSAAAAVVQTVWRNMSKARKTVAALRERRRRERAAWSLQWFWRDTVDREEAKKREAAAAVRRAAHREEKEAGVQCYTTALSTLQRCGRGVYERGAVVRLRGARLSALREEKAKVLSLAFKSHLARRRAQCERDVRDAKQHHCRAEAVREVAATRIGAVFRGHAARRRAVLCTTAGTRRVSRQIDQTDHHRRAAIRIQRMARVWLGLRCAPRVAQESKRRQELSQRRLTESRWWAAVLLQAVWRGSRARSDFKVRSLRRQRLRRDHLASVGERYRGVHFDDSYIAELAEEANRRNKLLNLPSNVVYASQRRRRCLDEPIPYSPNSERRRRQLVDRFWRSERRSQAASSTSRSSPHSKPQQQPDAATPPRSREWLGMQAEADRAQALQEGVDAPIDPRDLRQEGEQSDGESSAGSIGYDRLIPGGWRRRTRSGRLSMGYGRVRILFFCMQRAWPGVLNKQGLVQLLADFATPCTLAAGKRIFLDMSRVALPGMQYDDDGMQHTENAFLRLPKAVLRRVLDGVYAEHEGGAPRICERWDMVLMLERVAREWGIHCLSQVLSEDGLMECIELQLDFRGPEDFKDYLISDPAGLIYEERLTPRTRVRLCQTLRANRGEDAARQIYEWGVRQILSVCPKDGLASILSLLLPELPFDSVTPEQAESAALRALLG